MSYLLYVALGLSLLAIIYAFFLYQKMMKASPGEEKVQEISSFIKEGANAFIKGVFYYINIYCKCLFVIWISPLGLASGISFCIRS